MIIDAIALTRGDRFYTTDFTPYNYTNWGYTVSVVMTSRNERSAQIHSYRTATEMTITLPLVVCSADVSRDVERIAK
jgi:hypothetical protein